jgi:hypothetical protein
VPVVVGLFSGLDLEGRTTPSITVTTAVHSAHARGHQAILWLAAAAAAAAALLLVATGQRRSVPAAGVVRAGRRALRSAGPPDAVVAALLLIWWVVGPAFFDDGWVLARQANFSESGGFSAYYTSFGVNLPLDYWLEWLEHWLVNGSSALVVLRIPALLSLAGTWVLCRWIWARTLAPPKGGDRAARWALVGAFAAGSLAWGMTLRPEPTVALLVTGVLACVVRFGERESAAPLAVVATLVALALSSHPAGIVSLAPVLLVTPDLVRWARRHVKPAATIVASASALLVVLATLGSDLSLRLADTRLLRTYGDETAGWRDELTRYGLLSQPSYGSPLRRESVALLILAVAAYVLRRRREPSRAPLDLPTATLGIALLLLIATPTKWPWHFGALIGIGALAVAAETARLRLAARSSRGWDARPFVVIVAAVVTAAWAWFPRNAWGDLDLLTLQWTLSFENRTLTLAKVAATVPVLLLGALALLELRRGRSQRRLPDVAWRTATWTVPVLALPLVAFTIAVLVADTVKTSSWTLARQNLESLTGRLDCGLADDALVARPSSMRPLATVGSGELPTSTRGLPAGPGALPRFLLGPPPSDELPARSAWFRLPARGPTGFYIGGAPQSSDTLGLEWGRIRGGQVELLSTERIPGDFAHDVRTGPVDWRFLPAGSLPSRPPGSDAVRFALRSEVVPGSVVALTAPVSYATEPLSARLERGASRTLALPNLLTYVPCVRQPRVGRGVAQVPSQLIAFSDSIWPLGTGTSPFDGLADLYELERLPLADSPHPPGDVAVYDIRWSTPGSALAAPDEQQITS